MKSTDTIAVVGLGYVGLPLALLAARKKFSVFGLDIDKNKIDSLNKKESYIGDVSNSEVAESTATFSSDFSLVGQSNIVIVCVPTPVSHDKQPDLGPVKGAIASVSPFLKKGTLVVIESTVNPGVCDEVVAPLIKELTGLEVGSEIYLAHCPERINPGDERWNVSNINRVIGANSKNELDIAVELYEKLINAEIKPMGSLKEAEAVKVVENSFRDINIAFVNELAMSFHRLGINIENVIDGAATKPFAFMPHRPGAGVGGHCIPVDPYYLMEYARTYGFEHEFLRNARSINEGMPRFTVDLVIEALNELGLALKDTRVTMLGLSYKSNVGDGRESPAYVLKEILNEYEVRLTTFDPYLPKESSAPTLDAALKNVEVVVIATGHNEFKEIDFSTLKKNGVKVIVDGRNLYRHKINEIKSSGILYRGIGIQ